MTSIGRITVAALLVWLGFLIYASTVLVRVHQQSGSSPETNADADATIERLTKALEDVEKLKNENKNLKSWLNENLKKTRIPTRQAVKGNEYPRRGNISTLEFGHFSRNHEDLRRLVKNGLFELWYSINSKLTKLKERQSSQDLSQSVDHILNWLSEQHRSVLSDTLKLGEVDGGEQYRHDQLLHLTSIVQQRLEFLQNPANCSTARKLICNLNKGCGFGCQIHHAAYCFVMAYASNRTLILNTAGWRYSSKGWESVFLPVSNTCLEASEATADSWKGIAEQKNTQVVSIPIVDSLRPRPPQLPLSFPKDLADKLLLLHSDPPVWWVAQFVWYLMRYQPLLTSNMQMTSQKMGFKTPIVGIHVRRTDKVGSEAAFHSIEEYMKFAEAWFQLQALKNGVDNSVRRVYLATDEPNLIAETKKKFPKYEIIAETSNAESAQLNSRYSDSSLHGVIADIHFLARCDYLVCTFSSQVCRVAYELMQILQGGDVADRFVSLDDIYYFGGQEGHEQEVVMAHKSSAPDEIDLQVGDTVGIAGNHWDGYSKGRNARSGQTGLYPSYKTKEKWRVVDFPVYPPQV